MPRHLRQCLPDSELYRAYARTIYEGKPYQVGGDYCRRAPGYPSFIAGCWLLVQPDSPRAVLWSQVLLSTLGCWLVFRTARWLQTRGLPPGSAWLALVLAVLDPYAIALAGLELSETVFTTLLLGSVLIGCRLTDRASRGWSIWLGCCSGLAVLVRPSGLLLAPVGGACWWLANRGTRVGGNLAWAGIGFLLTLCPWWVRNAQLYGACVPTTLNLGESLYDGLNPQASGGSDMGFLSDPQITRLSELQRDRYWRRQAILWAWDHPGRVVELAGLKFVRYWSPWPNAAPMRACLAVIATTAWTVAVWTAALLAAWKLRRQAGIVMLGFLPISYFCGLHLVFASSVRYRVPAMSLVSILGGVGMVMIADYGLRIADCRLRIADCGLRIADCGLRILARVRQWLHRSHGPHQ